MPFALDYSARPVPTAQQVLGAGYVGVVRYIGFDPAQRPKCITAAEYADMDTHGVGVALVYENQAGDMLGGAQAGTVAAQRARQWATRIGFPAARPIYYACDTDIVTADQFDAVIDYLRAAAAADGGVGRVGVYGEYDVLERAAAAGAASWFWQTRAWSGGRVNARAQLRQEIGQVTVGGVACDRNTLLAEDWGQHNAVPEQEDDVTPEDIAAIAAAVNAHTDAQVAAAQGEILRQLAANLGGSAVNNPNAWLNAGIAARLGANQRAALAPLMDDEAQIVAAVGATHADLATAIAAVQAGGAVPESPEAYADAVLDALRDRLGQAPPPQ
jgi:hypothetical protein